jgi:hypothetical protein
MRDRSHTQRTCIATILASVNAWRKQEGWSRETVIDSVVEAHKRIGGPDATGIRFDPNTRDTYERMKVNADRVYRWLDDATKDNNLLPVNFLPSILAALPESDRMHLVDELLRPLGLASRVIGDQHETQQPVGIAQLQYFIRESSEAAQAVAGLVDGASRDELEKAQKDISESLEIHRKLLGLVETSLIACWKVHEPA